MSNSKLYSIKDTKIGFTQIFILPNNAAAIRWFGEIALDEKNPIGKHPEDYQLFAMGELNEETGEITSKIDFLENATAFIIKKQS